MSTTIAEDFTEQSEPPASSSVVAWIALLVGLSLVVGGLAAVFWSGVVDLPAYTIQPDESAVIGERGLTQVVSADVWYVITGALVGTGLGILTWKWFRPLGWPSALLAAGSGLLAGLVCWKLGEVMGPGPFAERLAKAVRGDTVSMSLELRAWSALAVWGFAAVTPVLLASSLGPDDEDPGPRRRTKRVEVPEASPTVDELGVVTTEEG
ncbi:MAG: hypothetical protein CVT62_01260 [Actinobacteria bacterium HGW-Actinobacteria-2]|nr:MAG: hypothetical protein CVT62_01260 [Actinobacteria bacterium HGW-Actinobacteria-2]